MKLKKRILFNLILVVMLLLIPLNTFAYSKYLIPGGENIGIQVNNKYITVVGFYEVDNKYIAKDAGFNVGDKILKINDQDIQSMNDMVSSINDSMNRSALDVLVLRKNKKYNINLNIFKDNDGVIKTGLYVKNQISGIGTLTYIDPSTNKFGALGHHKHLWRSAIKIVKYK